MPTQMHRLSLLVAVIAAWCHFFAVASFRCTDGLGSTLSDAAVNDDFCDCTDGSDEPGTAACAGQDSTLYLCQNSGSTPQQLYASRVRDGICDCCDGSDEAPAASKRQPIVSCPNTCIEDGIKGKAYREEQASVLRAGLEAQGKMMQRARGERKTWRSELARLEKELPALEEEHAKLQAVREAREAAETSANDTNVTEANTTTAPESASESVTSVEESAAEESKKRRAAKKEERRKAQEKREEERKRREEDQEKEKRKLKDKWKLALGEVYAEAAEKQKLADETKKGNSDKKERTAEIGSSTEEVVAEKSEVKVVSEYAAWMDGAQETMGGEEATGKSKQFTATIAKKDGKLGMAIKFEQRMAVVSEVLSLQAGDLWNKQEGQQHQIKPKDCILKANDVEVHSEQDFKDNVGTDPVVLLIEIGCEGSMQTTTTTTYTSWSDKKLDPEEEEAKTKVKSHSDRIDELRGNLKAVDDTKLHYASLHGVTLEKKFGEHDYKIVFFKEAKQGYTDLGTWNGWTGAHSCEFTHGSSCWQGDERRLSVQFECGAEQELLDVSEPSRCTYAAVVAHPGACDAGRLETLANPPTRGPRDEL